MGFARAVMAPSNSRATLQWYRNEIRYFWKKEGVWQEPAEGDPEERTFRTFLETEYSRSKTIRLSMQTQGLDGIREDKERRELDWFLQHGSTRQQAYDQILQRNGWHLNLLSVGL